MHLKVRTVEVRTRLQEGAGLQKLPAAYAFLEEQVVDPDQQGLQALALGIDGDRLGTGPGQGDVQVILQVLADAGQGVDRLDPGGGQGGGIADPGQLEDLGRLHGAGAEQDLPYRLRLGADPGLLVGILDAGRHAVLDQDPGRPRAGHAGEVRAGQGGMEVAAGGAPPLAVMNSHLIGAPALLLAAVEIPGQGMAGLRTGLDGRSVDRVRV